MAGFNIGIPGVASVGFSSGAGVSTRKYAKNLRAANQSNKIDRYQSYEQALEYQPKLEAAHYQALRDAGLHPAFTGGQQGGGGQILAGGTAGYGGGATSDSGVASFKVANKYEALINEANLGLIAARTDEIQERTEASRAARAGLGNNIDNIVEVVPDRQIARDPKDSSKTAGNHPGWSTKEVSPGITFDFLGEEISENFENPVMALAFLERNEKKIAWYGLQHLYNKNPATYAKKIITWLYKMAKKPGNKLAQSRKYDSRVDARSPVRNLKP